MAYWDAIAVTAPKNEHAQEFLRELQTRQNEGLISKSTFLISIPDPLQDENSYHTINLNTVNEQGVKKEDHNEFYGVEKDQLVQTFAKIGSGTSTINSLFVICEKLSALSGKSYLDVDVLKEKKILLLLIGGIYQHAPLVNMCTKSFSMLPMLGVNLNYDNPDKVIDTYVGDPPVYPIDILLSNLNIITPQLQPGFMVASTESLILFDETDPNLKSKQLWSKPGVSIITMDVNSDVYKSHGVCKVDPDTNEIIEMSYKKPVEYLSKSGFIDKTNDKASLYTSILFFCEKTAEKLLYLYNTPPISSCTYLGIDSGSQMLKFGIYPDILCTMTKNETLESYLNLPTFHHCNRSLVDKGRRVLWNTFRNTPINSIKIKGEFIYLKNSEDFLNLVYYNKSFNMSKRVHSYIDCKKPVEGIVMNSILTGNGSVQKTSVVYSSVLTGNWSVGSNSIVLGVKGVSFGFEILDNMIVNEIRLKSDKIKLSSEQFVPFSTEPKALVVLGIHDDLNYLYDDPKATIANRSWSEFFLHSGISPDELWPKCVSKVLRTARLFPIITSDDEKLVEASLWIQSHESPSLSVIGRWRSSKRVSIADIIGESHLLDYSQLESVAEKKKSLKLMSKQIIEGNVEAEFKWRRTLSYKVDSLQVEKTLTQGEDVSILPFLHKWADSGIPIKEVLDTLDRISLSSPIKFTGRLLSCISDALAIYVNHKGGLRSGPARNSAWDKAFSYFKTHDERKGLLALAKEREKWLNSHENMIRAARHYEGAGQLVIKNIVDTCKTTLIPLSKDNGDTILVEGDWVEVSVPARIDLAGGWTDTPPICYEHGGIVINAAVTINGEHPIKVSARKVADPKISLYFDSIESDPVICTTLLDLSDYNQPLAPGALLKCCFLQLGFIDINSTKENLETQLKKLGGGFELISSSTLPTGSGLGTSSILASALIFAIAYVYGYKYTDQHLIHAVLKVEQMLTAGGGWNDPVGGIIGGFKQGKCSKFTDDKSDSITVTYDKIQVSQDCIDLINKHLVLIYTGRTRLARDLLQDVIRRWYSRTNEILSVTQNLIDNTVDMQKALLEGNLENIGKYLSVYWKDKKCMAIGAEPTRITEIFSLIQDHVYGSSLTGAGGGGFLIAISKEDKEIFKSKMKSKVEQVDGLEDIKFFDCEICLNGLTFKTVQSTDEQID